MIQNYFKIAIRNLLKNKGFSAINIIGLSIGLASFILITLYVIDELSYDRYNEKADRIYRINSDIRFGGNDLILAVTSDPMGPTLKKDYPNVEEYVRFFENGSVLLKKDNQFINEQNTVSADSTLFNVFTLPAIAGDTKNALDNPGTVVITASTAKKYFGTVEAVGKIIETEQKKQFKVTAVIKDIPTNSHFHFDFIFSMKDVQYNFGTFLSNNFQTYILLKKGVDYKIFEKNFDQVIEKYLLPQAQQVMQIKSMADFAKAGNKLAYSLIPLTDIHLHSDRTGELGTNGNIQYVYIFSAVALFVLLLACINFMNLSTAKSASRAKEVGIRKVMGSDKKSLVWQFLIESLLVSFFSFLLALIMVWLILPLFNDIASKSLSLQSLLGSKQLLLIILLPVIVGLLAGIYPAFYLSSFRPISVLKGKITTGFKRSGLRNSLVVFQFATSIILMIGTFIIFSQLHYIRTTKLGFRKEQVLIINNTRSLGNNLPSFKNDILQMPGISGATISEYLPVPSGRNDNTFSKEAVMDSKNGFNMQVWNVDYDYINTLGMEIIKGRKFAKELGTDSTGLLINETSAGLLGFADPIGKKLYTFYQLDNSNANILKAYTIIGVVKNFHFESLRQNISPLCMRLGRSNGLTSFKITTKDIQPLIKGIERKWKAILPSMPFSYRFMDDAFDAMYRTEQRVGKVAISFAILAILIACLGLFGLVTYAAEQRTREVGIRKVLGAGVASIVMLLSKELLLLVMISALVAFPIAWYTMHQWLADFAYRIDMSWWIFIVAGVIAAAIALLTISIQAIKAAMANPVKSLRTE
jgi:putative ABC transport system permease protein